MAIRAAVAAGLMFVVALAGCGDAEEGSAPTAQRFEATQVKLTRVSERGSGFRAGDSIVVTSDIAGGGHEEAYCVRSSHERAAWCAVTLVRPAGQISAEGVLLDAPKLSGPLALLSGSGEYEGASGSLTTSGVTERRHTITLRLR
jgi:hypothetical protein